MLAELLSGGASPGHLTCALDLVLTQKKNTRLLAVSLSNIQHFNILKFPVSSVCDSPSFLRSVKGVIDPTVTCIVKTREIYLQTDRNPRGASRGLSPTRNKLSVFWLHNKFKLFCKDLFLVHFQLMRAKNLDCVEERKYKMVKLNFKLELNLMKSDFTLT